MRKNNTYVRLANYCSTQLYLDSNMIKEQWNSDKCHTNADCKDCLRCKCINGKCMSDQDIVRRHGGYVHV